MAHNQRHMDALAHLFELVRKESIIQLTYLAVSTDGEDIFKLTYPDGYLMGTEKEIRASLTKIQGRKMRP